MSKMRHLLKKIEFLRYLYHRYLALYTLYERRKEQNHFVKIGEEVISHVQETLSKTPNIFFFDMGTLLGIYRDGHLLKRDMDIDVGVQISSDTEIYEIRSILLFHGFIHKFVFSTDIHGIIQDTFVYKSITVDISYYRRAGEYDYIYMLYNADDVIKMLCRHVEGVKLYHFGKILINIPENTDQYLEDRYGNDWKIPNPKYKYWEGPSVVKVGGRGICEKVTNS